MNWVEDEIKSIENKLRPHKKSLKIQMSVVLLNVLVLIFDIATNNHTMWSGFGIGGMFISLIWSLFMLAEFYFDCAMSRNRLKFLKNLNAADKIVNK